MTAARNPVLMSTGMSHGMKDKSFGIIESDLFPIAKITANKTEIRIAIPNVATPDQATEIQRVFEISFNEKLASLKSIFPNRNPSTEMKNTIQLGISNSLNNFNI